MDVVRRDRGRPLDAVLVLVLLHDRSHRPPGPNPIAAHHERLLLSVLVEECRPEADGVERPEFEDVPELDGRLLEQPPAAHDAGVALVGLPDVGEVRLVVASRLHAAQVPAVAIRTRDVLALPQRLVGDDVDRHRDRPERATACAEDRPDLLLRHRPVRLAQVRDELLLAEPVVAANEGEHRPLPDHDGHRLRRRRRVDAEELRQRLDRCHAWRLDLLGPLEWIREHGLARNPPRRVVVRVVIAVLAADEDVLAGFGRRHEPGRLAPAHDPRLGLDVVRLEPAALPDALVRALVRVEAFV